MDFSPTGGLNTWHRPEVLEPGQATIVRNFAMDRSRSLRTRRGIRKLTNPSGGAWPTTYVLGIHQSFNEAGTARQFVKIGGSYYNWSFSGNEVVLGAQFLTGTSAAFKPHMVAFNNIVILFDEDKTYATDGTTTVPIGEPAPDGGLITLTPQVNPDLDLQGEYIYTFVFHNTTLDVRSQITELKQVEVTDPNGAVQVAINVADPADFDRIEIYRTAGGGTELFLVQSIETSTLPVIFLDDIPDTSLVGRTLSGVATAPPEGARAAGYFQGRLWYAPTDRLTHVRFSEPGEPYWPLENLIRIGEQDGDTVNAFVDAGGIFYAIRDHSMFVLRGSDETTYRWDPIEGGVGGQSPHAVAAVGGVIYVFNHEQWIYRFRNAQLQPIGRPVRELVLQEANLVNGIPEFDCDYEPRSESVWFLLGGLTGQFMLVFFHRTGTWAEYTFSATTLEQVTDMSGERRLMLGNEWGDLWFAEDHEGAVDGFNATGVTRTISQINSTLDFDVTPALPTSFEYRGTFITILHQTGGKSTVFCEAQTLTNIELQSAASETLVIGDVVLFGTQVCEWVGGRYSLGNLFDDKRAPGTMKVSMEGGDTSVVELSLTRTADPDYVATKPFAGRGVVRHKSKGGALRFTPAMRYQDDPALDVFGLEIPTQEADQKAAPR